MKISSIKLAGFRSHVKTAITGLDRVSIFVGPNGAGKSSILDAIGFALTGITRGLDEGGKGAEALACQLPSVGKASTSVTLQTDKGEIVRGLGQGPKSQAHINIISKLALDQKVLRVLAAPTNLLRLPVKKQEEIFFSMTGSAVTTDTIGKALTEAGIDLDATPVDLEDLLAPEGRANKLTFWKERRVEMKREIGTLVFTPSEQELPAADEVKRRRLESEMAKLDDSIRRGKGAGEQAQNSIRHFDELVAKAKAKVDELLKVQSVKVLAPAEVKKLRARIDEATGWRDEIIKKRQDFGAAANKKSDFTAEAEKIKALGRECSACGQEITKAATDKKLAGLREAFKAISAEVVGLSGEIKELEQKAAAVDVNSLLTQINGAERAVEDNKRNAEALAAAKKDLAEYQARRDDIQAPEGEKDWTEEEIKLADLRQQIEVLKAAEVEEGRQLSVNTRRSEIEENLEIMEKMLKAVGPGGSVQQAMAAGGTDEMVQMVRAIGAKLGVGDIGVKFGPWQITLNGRDIELASASEEFRVAAAFGIAFAEKAGASIVLLDGAEILRGDNRGLFQELIFSTGLEQVFIAFASDSIPESYEAVDGLAMFSVAKGEDGASKVSAIKQTAAV